MVKIYCEQVCYCFTMETKKSDPTSKEEIRSEWCSVKASPTVHYIIISLFVQNNNKPVLRVKSGLVLAGVRTSSNCQVTPHHPSVSLSQLSHSISICDCFISDWCGAAAVDTVKYFTTTFLQPWKIFNRVGYNFTNIYISEREREECRTHHHHEVTTWQYEMVLC